jgi:hypothetical protein
MPTYTPTPRAMVRPGSLTVMAMAESALSACRTAGLMVLADHADGHRGFPSQRGAAAMTGLVSRSNSVEM